MLENKEETKEESKRSLCGMLKIKKPTEASDYKRKQHGRRKRYRLRHPQRLCAVLLLILLLGGLGAGNLILTGWQQSPELSFTTEQLAPLDFGQLHSANGIVMEADSGAVLGEKHSKDKIYPASLTKLMTAVVLLEHCDNLEDTVTFSPQWFHELYLQEASMAGFAPRETVQLRDLLYGMLLPSGAECCVAAADYVAGSEEAFVALMNEKAEAVGMANTHFANTTGLHAENHYSTVEDMARLLQYALRNDTFRSAFTSTQYHTTPSTQHPTGFTMQSTMFQSLKDTRVTDGEIVGGKTGYTKEAGLCLASMARIHGNEYIAVTAKAEGNHQTAPFHIQDAITLYNQLGAADV